MWTQRMIDRKKNKCHLRVCYEVKLWSILLTWKYLMRYTINYLRERKYTKQRHIMLVKGNNLLSSCAIIKYRNWNINYIFAKLTEQQLVSTFRELETKREKILTMNSPKTNNKYWKEKTHNEQFINILKVAMKSWTSKCWTFFHYEGHTKSCIHHCCMLQKYVQYTVLSPRMVSVVTREASGLLLGPLG